MHEHQCFLTKALNTATLHNQLELNPIQVTRTIYQLLTCRASTALWVLPCLFCRIRSSVYYENILVTTCTCSLYTAPSKTLPDEYFLILPLCRVVLPYQSDHSCISSLFTLVLPAPPLSCSIIYSTVCPLCRLM